MGNIFSIRLTDEDKVHLQQRMNETGKNATEVFKSAIYFTKIDAFDQPAYKFLHGFKGVVQFDLLW